jgi:hypothetical protein
MFKRYFILVCLSMAAQAALAFHPFGWLMDSRAIRKTLALCGKSPQYLSDYFKKHDKQWKMEDLGFGWKTGTVNISGWDIEVTGVLYYYRDSAVAYTLTAHTSAGTHKRRRQQKRLQPAFELRQDTIQPYVFNGKALCMPLPECPYRLPVVPQGIVGYMSPLSGTAYGHYAGGGTGRLLPNRSAFNAIADSLTDAQLACLLYAINPASRFTAIEYYWRHKARFGERPDFDAWIEKNFAAFPQLPWQAGCITYLEDSRYLVWAHSLMPKK